MPVLTNCFVCVYDGNCLYLFVSRNSLSLTTNFVLKFVSSSWPTYDSRTHSRRYNSHDFYLNIRIGNEYDKIAIESYCRVFVLNIWILFCFWNILVGMNVDGISFLITESKLAEWKRRIILIHAYVMFMVNESYQCFMREFPIRLIWILNIHFDFYSFA